MNVPLFHVAACNSQLIPTVQIAGTTVIMPAFDVDRFLRAVVEERIRVVSSAPAVFWRALQVRDMRHLRTEEEVFEALMEHLRLGTNGGRIRAVVSIFAREGVTILNEQIVRYAAEAGMDLIVMGTQGRTGMERLLLGSVAEKVLRDATCSVLVVKLPKRLT